MMEIKRLLALLLCGALLLTGCSRTKGTDTNSQSNTVQATSDSAGGEQNSSTQANNGNNASQDGNGTQDKQEDGNSTESSPAPTTATLSSKREYSDIRRTVSILGLQEYKKLKTDAYTDKAKKGKVFLVLFLEIYNKGIEKEYFNVNCLTASVDGKEIENTFLLNDPEGYPTIFANIEAGETAKGFIVWEVPKDWKKMKVDYQGWRDSDGISLTCNLTKKDLKKPEKYEP